MSGGRPKVLVLHGFGAYRWTTSLLTRRLRQRGLDAADWSYPWYRSVDEIAERLCDTIAELDANPEVSAIHLVAHSMGGIVCRAALLRCPPQKAGRLVLLATPNRGARAADHWTRVGAARWLPALAELSSCAESYVNRMAVPLPYEVAVVFASWDELVKRESATFPGAIDEVTVRGTHGSILFSRRVADCVANFVQSGKFHTPTAESDAAFLSNA